MLWLGVAGLAVLRGGGVTGEGEQLRARWLELMEGWVEVRLEVRGQMEGMVVTVVLLRLVTACDSWLDIWRGGDGHTDRLRFLNNTLLLYFVTGEVSGWRRCGYHVRAVAGLFVRWWGSGGLAGQGGGGTAGIDALLFLPAVAEPDSDHLLLHDELLGDHQDLL